MTDSPKQKLSKQIGDLVLHLHQPLGTDRFGTIFTGYNRHEPSFQLAIRQIPLKVENPENLELIKGSLDLLLKRLQKLSKSENIVKTFDSRISLNNLYLVADVCNDGSLEDKKLSLSPRQAVKTMKKIIEAVDFAHSNGIIHRDLRPSNILFHEGEVKIADFGLAEFTENEKKITKSIGNPIYFSPERFYAKECDEKTDIWSLGVIFFELVYKKMPWNGRNATDLFNNNIMKKEINFPKEEEIEGFKDLIERMLRTEKEDRIGLQEVLCHEIFQRRGKRFKKTN